MESYRDRQQWRTFKETRYRYSRLFSLCSLDLNYALALTSSHVIYAELLRGSLVIFTWRIFLYDTRCVDSTNRSAAIASIQ